MEEKFQPYDQNQALLFPPSLEQMIEEKALVRVVNRVLNEVRGEVLEAPFEGGGRPAYHPRMMLKVIVYAYCRKIYSCRRMEQALRRDVAFMWLAGWQQPDFRTINRFRSEYFQEVLPQVFADVVSLLVDEGYIRSRDYFVDGTKWAADAYKYSAVWRKNTERYKGLVEARAREILKEVEELNRKEDEELGEKNLPECGEEAQLTSEKLKRVAEGINRALEGAVERAGRRSMERCAGKLEKEAQKLAEYEEQERLLGERNSYSRTDPDATFMRMKNEELRAGYNVQLGSQDGFITGCSVHQQANDGATLQAHWAGREELKLPKPQRMTTDAGYGNEENYQELEKEEVEAYLKYPDFNRDAKDNQGDFHWTRFKLDDAQHRFICPEGRALTLRGIEERKQVSGFKYQVEVYESESCAGCPFRTACTKGTNRTIHYNRRLHSYRRRAFERLTSPAGRVLCKQRGNACESLFGDLKHNQGIGRFRLRGLAKVKSESWLWSISYNLRKLFGQCAIKSA